MFPSAEALGYFHSVRFADGSDGYFWGKLPVTAIKLVHGPTRGEGTLMISLFLQAGNFRFQIVDLAFEVRDPFCQVGCERHGRFLIVENLTQHSTRDGHVELPDRRGAGYTQGNRVATVRNRDWVAVERLCLIKAPNCLSVKVDSPGHWLSAEECVDLQTLRCFRETRALRPITPDIYYKTNLVLNRALSLGQLNSALRSSGTHSDK